MEFEITDDNIRPGYNLGINFCVTLPNGDDVECLLSPLHNQLWIYAEHLRNDKGNFQGLDITVPTSPFHRLMEPCLTAQTVSDLPFLDDFDDEEAYNAACEEQNDEVDNIARQACSELEEVLEDEVIIAAFKNLLKV